MTLENISASVFERKKPLIELADSVKDKDGAVSFLRYNYLSIKEAEENENYELAAAIKEEMVKVWNKYKKEIKELMYNMETGELVDVLLDGQGAKEFIKHGEFINLQENYLWGDRQLIDESEYKDYLLTDDLDSVWSQFDEQYQFLNKVDDLRNQSGAIARTEKLDLVIKLNSTKDIFADFQKLANDKLKSIWDLHCASNHLEPSPYEDQLSQHFVEKSLSLEELNKISPDIRTALEYWQKVSDNAFVIVEGLNDLAIVLNVGEYAN